MHTDSRPRFTSLRYAAFLGLVAVYLTSGTSPAKAHQSCASFCTPYVDCAEWCEESPGNDITCGYYEGGESSGHCGGYYYGYCGDGYCNPYNGENAQWCPDCWTSSIGEPVDVLYPDIAPRPDPKRSLADAGLV